MNINGKYEIIEMELWDKAAIDLTETGYFKIDGKLGSFHFICVDGKMRISEQKGGYTFKWRGNDECDPASGHGNFQIKENRMIGRLYFKNGDDSSFTAVKSNS